VAGRLVGEQSKGAIGLELCHHVFGDKSRETGRTARQVVVVEGRIGSEVLKEVPSSGSFEEAPEGREVAEARVRRCPLAPRWAR
jgi:ribosomal protein S19E (S16A)